MRRARVDATQKEQNGPVPSKLERLFFYQIQAMGLQSPVLEYRFHSVRRWRFDFAWPDYLVAAEIEGAIWTGGRHTSGSGFTADCEKYNEAALSGWRVFRFTGDMVKSGNGVHVVKSALT